MNKNHNNSLDEELFEEFQALYFDDYEYLAPSAKNKEKNKTNFLAEKIENPTFIYPNLYTFDFIEKEKGFKNLKQQAAKHESHIVRDAYAWRTDEMLDQIKMLRAARDGNDNQFTKYSGIIYGNPSPEIFEYDKFIVVKALEKARASNDQNRINAAYKLEKLIGDLSYGKSLEEKFSLLPKPIEDNGKILNASEIKSMFENALEELSIANWTIAIDKTGEKVNLSADQETKTINIPDNNHLSNRAKKTTATNIKALIAHELKTHALRRENGEKSKLKLLGLGLDRFLKGEEGLASYKYQQLEGANDFAAFRSHLSISLARGIDGTKRDFRGVFEIIKCYLLASMNNDNGESLIDKIETIAWNTCVRCFRGTTCKTPGAVFTKGHIYREGNIGIYQLVNSGSKEVGRFMCGKYDPLNPHHKKILDLLGI